MLSRYPRCPGAHAAQVPTLPRCPRCPGCSCLVKWIRKPSKVLQLVDLYGVAVNEHGVSQPVTVIPTHQLPTVTSSLPPQSLRTASTSFDLLVEYIEPVTPKKTVISHFDKQAHIPIFCEQHREALIPYMRGMISLSHDMRDQGYLSTADLDRLTRIETALKQKDLEDDESELFAEMLPLTTMENFKKFDDELKKPWIKKCLNNHLIGIGGNEPKTIVRLITRRLRTKDVGKLFSWYGQRGNVCLSNTNVGKSIITAAKRTQPMVTEQDAIKMIQALLRHCKDKEKNNEVRGKKNYFMFVRSPVYPYHSRMNHPRMSIGIFLEGLLIFNRYQTDVQTGVNAVPRMSIGYHPY
ncbi:hypothetical protein OUZ56_005313 [Daphnia magna]|uniref:DUF4806 domain-containing protein n=1 Tax=Daphnia magna TaxID=35525 RepID=A0ABQ9YSJ8_9CRUS|nr:hypothetical protein OUZ56_005313 [Daphnia magna]